MLFLEDGALAGDWRAVAHPVAALAAMGLELTTGPGTCGAVRSRRGGACAESGGADPSPFEREISDATDAASTRRRA